MVPDSAAPNAGRSHLTTELRFIAPADWEDHSILMLTAPPVRAPNVPADAMGDVYPPPTSPFAVSLHRDAPLDGEDLSAYLARQVAGLTQSIPDLKVLRRGTRDVGGQRAEEIEYAWTAEGGRMRQHQVHVLRAGRILTWTATAPAVHWLTYAPQFTALLATVRFVPLPVTIAAPVRPVDAA